MNLDHDLERIAAQERRLRFASFDEDTAWGLCSVLRARAEARGASVTIEVRLAGATVALTAMPGTAPANADWARRKRNVVETLHRSSYAVGLAAARSGGATETQMMGLADRDYACHGGGFPIMVNGVGFVGAVTVSGLPQREDHNLVVEVLADILSVPLAEIALSPRE